MPDQRWIKKLFSVFTKKNPESINKSEGVNETSTSGGDSGNSEKKPSRRERRKAKKELYRSRPLKVRIAIQTAKTFLIRIPLAVIVITISSLLFIRLYFNPPVVEELAKKTFNEISNGTLELKVKKFNLFRGFEINNILIRNGEEFGNSKFIAVKKIAMEYSLLEIVTGSVRFPEIGIYDPKIFIKQKGESWNFEKLMKPSDSEKEEKTEEIKDNEEDEDKKDIISLPIAVDFLLNFTLDNLQVFVKGNDFNGELKGLTFGTKIEIPPFKEIPLSVEIIKLIKTMKIQLNPENEMELKYFSRGLTAKPDLTLMWKLIFENGDEGQFVSKLNVGSRRLPLRLKNRYITPLNFFLKYDIIYKPSADSLVVNNLSLSFKNRNWLKLAGNIDSVAKNQRINFRMIESDINLGDLYPYYLTFTGDRNTRFRGNVSLYPLTIRGTLNKQDIKGSLKMSSINLQVPGTSVKIPSSSIGYSLYRNNNYISLNTQIALNNFSYILQGSRSGLNSLKLDTALTSPDNFKSVNISKLNLKFYDPLNGRNALDLSMNSKVTLSPVLSGAVNITRFRFNKNPLVSMVPQRLKRSITDIPLNKTVSLKLDTKFKLTQLVTDATLNLYASVPDYKVNDIVLKTSLLQNNRRQRIQLRYFTLGSKSQNLKVSAAGHVELKEVPISDSYLDLSVELDNKKDKSVLGPWMSRGKMNLTASVKGNLKTGKAKGRMKFSDFSIYNIAEKTYLTGLDMDFPFFFDFAKQKDTSSQLLVSQKNIIESNRYDPKPNFHIKSFKSKHPARNISYEYLRDFSAHLSFDNRVFKIHNLKAEIMEGSLYGRSVLFNLGNFSLEKMDIKTEDMEFSLMLDGTNIDLSLLDNPNPKKKSTSAELSFSSNFSGKGLNIEKELTADGYINIYEIGNKFANRLMKGLSVEKGKSKLGRVGQFAIDNSMLVKNFDFRLKNGLIYTTVNLTRKIISALITVDNSKVEFNRITVQEYLRNIMKNEEDK